jgi:hypothetical protein
MIPTNYLIIEAIKAIEEPFKNKDKKPRFINLKDSDIWWVDLPRHRDLYHGTTFSIRCKDKQCTFIGDIVIPRNEEHIISDKLKKSDCDITSIHQHPESIMATIPGKEEQKKESHIHFKCNRKSHNDTMKIANFLREL